jgi:hypothetical protein
MLLKNALSINKTLETTSAPLRKFITDNHHPTCTVFVTSTSAELFEGIESIVLNLGHERDG